MTLRVDILANDGSPLGVTPATMMGDDPIQIGVGGAELGILTLCELWTKAGYKVRFYNNPRLPNPLFEQLPLTAFNPQDDRDVLIVFRSPNTRIEGAKGLKVWFSTDQFTIGNYKDFAPKVDKIVTISPFHAQYFKEHYGIENTITIDLPVRIWEYEKQVEKVPGRCLFSSVPDRGLFDLLKVWPQVVGAFPEASLVITSDYRLWGCPTAQNQQYLNRLEGLKNITMRGAMRRPEFVMEQLKAEYLLYPSNYEELFCYAVAEAQVAGMWPVTTRIGALETTNMGWLTTREDFANKAISALSTLGNVHDWMLRYQAIDRFGPERILAKWNTIFGGA